MNPAVMLPEDLLEEIKQYKLSNGYSDDQMSKLLNCSRSTYSNTVNGKKKVGNTFFSGAIKLISQENDNIRTAVVKRETSETNINLELNIDGTGRYEIEAGINMFEHLLSQMAKHGMFDIKLEASGDDTHHTVEDTAICLGVAFNEALGDKRGIERTADVTVPMDDALVTVAVDISGRGYAVLNTPLGNGDLSDLPADLVRHFLESFAIEARLNLHASILYGRNDHHKAEALFKALGKALDRATRIDERIRHELPTTKGYLQS
jgi:imidazoleglycerol-phosphate dehydratase